MHRLSVDAIIRLFYIKLHKVGLGITNPGPLHTRQDSGQSSATVTVAYESMLVRGE
jgi:hypothetical protein